MKHPKVKNMQLKCLLIIVSLYILSVCCASCKKFVTVPAPQTSISQTSVYTTDATAIAVLTGIYAKISNSSITGAGNIASLSLYSELSADELTLWSGVTSLAAQAYYKNALTTVSTGYGSEFWTTIYPYVFACNAAIEGLNGANSLTPAVRQQLLGEAKFMRALFYFYLVNLYGDVPMPLSSNYKTNGSLPRTPTNEVYQQIISDLHESQQALSSNFLDATLQRSSPDRVRPTVWAATALLARTYLFVRNWAGADSAASVLLNNSSLFKLSNLDTTFLRASKNNNEAIWQLQPVTASPANTYDAYIFSISSTGLGTAGNFGAYLSNSFINSFEPGDKRKDHWTNHITIGGATYYYPYKYKVNSTSVGTPVNEHYMMLRLGEQYLIRAEARTNEGNIGGAQADLDSLRSRAGLPGTSASTASDLITAILHERRMELFTELGQRWLDLKRSNTIDSIMGIVTPEKGGGAWNSYQKLYPVFSGDIQNDPNLMQNPGYQ